MNYMFIPPRKRNDFNSNDESDFFKSSDLRTTQTSVHRPENGKTVHFTTQSPLDTERYLSIRFGASASIQPTRRVSPDKLDKAVRSLLRRLTKLAIHPSIGQLSASGTKLNTIKVNPGLVAALSVTRIMHAAIGIWNAFHFFQCFDHEKERCRKLTLDPDEKFVSADFPELDMGGYKLLMHSQDAIKRHYELLKLIRNGTYTTRAFNEKARKDKKWLGEKPKRPFDLVFAFWSFQRHRKTNTDTRTNNKPGSHYPWDDPHSAQRADAFLFDMARFSISCIKWFQELQSLQSMPPSPRGPAASNLPVTRIESAKISSLRRYYHTFRKVVESIAEHENNE